MNNFDCDLSYCEVCNSNSTNYPCTGVIGGSQQNDPPGPYGADKTYIDNLRGTDNSTDKINCSSGGNLGWYNKSGGCGDDDFKGINNVNLLQKDPLVVGSEKCASEGNVIKTDGEWGKFPLQTLHKIWGDAGGKYNHGVQNKNVYVAPEENVSFTINGATKSVNQNIIIMEAHGDKYTGDVPGLKTEKNSQQNDNIPSCPKIVEDINLKNRVGGVVTTRGQYGPGVYNILCYVPKTEDENTEGRGYVFAAWPFHYEEIYVGQNPQNTTTNSQARGDLSGPNAPTDFPCYNQCDGGKTNSVTCTKSCSGKESDLYSVINHEIDIEIPNNSPQFANDWKDKMTWDTMNCNTWLNDINNYDSDTGAYYTQVAVKNTKRTFISDKSEKDTNKDYHWYTIDWYVDNNDYTKNYVKFYFDDPFDPNGKSIGPDGTPLPTSPSGKEISKGDSYGLVHSTRRFVPTRAGRFNVGPWFGWWGYNGQNGGKPNFDTAKVRLAYLNIIPYGTGFSFPQNYDQVTPYGTISCDFKDLYSVPGPRPKPPSPTPGPKPKPKSNIGLILGITISLVLLIGIITAYFLIKRKSKK